MPSPEIGTFPAEALVGDAIASVAENAPVAVVAVRKWRRSRLMATSQRKLRVARLQEAGRARCIALGQRLRVNGAARRAAPAKWPRRRAPAPRGTRASFGRAAAARSEPTGCG